MRIIISILLLVIHCSVYAAPVQQSQAVAEIKRTLHNYIAGTSFNRPGLISKAFYPEADLLLANNKHPVWKVPAKEYVDWFKKKPGQFNGRIGEIMNIDVDGELATAKVEILLPQSQRRYVDVFILKKIDTHWQIISKAANSETTSQTAERILFIVSSAHFHGESKLPAGASFSEIVHAFDTFKQAGYTVDFVSPDGGPIPLSYINTSIPIHKQYLYNSDFMFALRNTKTPEQLVASDYRAVHYVGGSNAMYGVPENTEIAQLVMEIYEQHNGIVSSVCHGTAGIVNLKTSDGKYLVAGKRISGYPEDYENQHKPHFKEFPFLIKKTITQRDGTFKFGPRNQPYIEVDGRVITGQNYLSSTPVALEIIKQLQSQKS